MILPKVRWWTSNFHPPPHFNPKLRKVVAYILYRLVAHDHLNINDYNSMFHSENREFHYCGFVICIFGWYPIWMTSNRVLALRCIKALGEHELKIQMNSLTNELLDNHMVSRLCISKHMMITRSSSIVWSHMWPSLQPTTISLWWYCWCTM